MSEFFNPYAFVPAPARPEGGAPFPAPLGRLSEDRWTGSVRIRLTARTPLLMTEQQIGGNGSVARRTRQIAGEVVVVPSSVKGMVRAEYEMVTNSRFGVFHEHGHRLAFRESAGSSQDLVPARVVEERGAKMLLPLEGRGSPNVPHRGTMLKAAWVPRYPNGITMPVGVGHGSLVWAWVVEVRREGIRHGDWRTDFHYWRVVEIVPGPQRPGTPPPLPPDRPSGGRRRHSRVDPDAPAELIRGWYFHSNRNIKGKHDERIFFTEYLASADRRRPALVPVPATVVQGWAVLIASYHAAHDRKEIHERRWPAGGRAEPTDYLGDKPGQTAWSRHLMPEGAELDALMTLPKDTLCYASIDKNTGEAVELFPVALSRRLYDRSPAALAGRANLAPASTHGELSAADRLFGWVPSEGRGADRSISHAVRGRVRFGPVRATDAEPEEVGRGLAVLERPRPTQDLFYAAENPRGAPLRGQRGYREGQGLRGRKVYPHQPDTSWDPTTDQPWLLHGTGLTGDGAPDAGKQNAVLVDRIPVGATFDCDLHVEDLTGEELGALLYVLRGRNAGAWSHRMHKLGGGKPLGFGSVLIEVTSAQVRTGSAWLSYFALDDESADPTQPLDESAMDELVRAAVVDGGAHLTAYEAYLSGFPSGTPVRYPADPAQPESDENRYAWFVDNRRERGERRGQRRVLGELTADYWALRLPVDPTVAEPQRGNGRRSR